MTERADLPKEVADLIGARTEIRWGADEVSKAQIRYWIEMVEDANPLYTDEEYARASKYQGIIAPPPMLMTWAYGPLWPAENVQLRPTQRVRIPGCDHNAAVNSVQEYLLPVRPGDRIGTRDVITDISPRKTTRLGEGHFVTQVTEYVNQRGGVVGRNILTVFKYRPPPKVAPKQASQEVGR